MGEIVGTITLEWAEDAKEFVAGSIHVDCTGRVIVDPAPR